MILIIIKMMTFVDKIMTIKNNERMKFMNNSINNNNNINDNNDTTTTTTFTTTTIKYP